MSFGGFLLSEARLEQHLGQQSRAAQTVRMFPSWSSSVITLSGWICAGIRGNVTKFLCRSTNNLSSCGGSARILLLSGNLRQILTSTMKQSVTFIEVDCE